MNTLTKFSLRTLGAPALALAALTPFAAANAGESSDDIVVTSTGEMQAWQASVTRSLDRALQRNPLERTATPGSGIVQVSFSMGADGRPDNIEIYNSTANWSAQRSAIYAVRRLGDLSNVPVSNAQDVQFLANVIFADDAAEHNELAQALARSERTRLASGTSASAMIALGR